MKGIAIILSACMLVLNAGYLLENTHLHAAAEAHGMECCSDSASSCCDAEDAPQENEKSCHGDSPCIPGCACYCHFQLTALVYNFLEMEGIAVQSYHYGNYLNTYSFEYSDDFLQPPRKA